MNKDEALKFIAFLAGLFTILYIVANKILQASGLELMNNVKYFALVIFVAFAGVITALINLKNLEKYKKIDWSVDKNFSVIGLVAMDIFVGIVCVAFLIGGKMFLPSEQITKRGTIDMVESPPSFFDSRTNYYEYYNDFVKGNEIVYSKIDNKRPK